MKVKAYGKLLLFGGYSILEPGGVGLAVNLNRGTTCEVAKSGSGKLIFDMKNFKINIETDKNEFHLLSNPVMAFLKNAVKYSFEYLKSKDIKIEDIKLSTYNDPEFKVGKHKTGFGSSATATVSAVAAILKQHNIDDRDIVFKISRYAHYKSQDGMGSGYDIAVSCYGSQFFRTQKEDLSDFFTYIYSDSKVDYIGFDLPQKIKYLVAFSGKSSNTKNLVAKVLQFKKRQPEIYTKLMIDYNYANETAMRAFLNDDLRRISSTLELSWDLRKRLGAECKVEIESEKITALRRLAKENGAYCIGLTGAGGGDNIFAICEDKQKASEFLEDNGYYVLSDVKIDNLGYEFQD